MRNRWRSIDCRVAHRQHRVCDESFVEEARWRLYQREAYVISVGLSISGVILIRRQCIPFCSCNMALRTLRYRFSYRGGHSRNLRTLWSRCIGRPFQAPSEPHRVQPENGGISDVSRVRHATGWPFPQFSVANGVAFTGTVRARGLPPSSTVLVL